MYMTEAEIIGKFRRADNKKEILQILADLNGCSEDDMKSFLLDHGISEKDFPAKRVRKRKVENVDTENPSPPPGKPVKTHEITPNTQTQTGKADLLPPPVLRAIEDKILILAERIKELEKERDCLCEYIERKML